MMIAAPQSRNIPNFYLEPAIFEWTENRLCGRRLSAWQTADNNPREYGLESVLCGQIRSIGN